MSFALLPVLHEHDALFSDNAQYFETDYKLTKREQDGHKPDDRHDELICPFCEKQFPTTSSLNRHKHTVHLPPKFHCQICDKRFTRKASLKKHLKKLHNMGCCFHCLDVFSLDKSFAHICRK